MVGEGLGFRARGRCPDAEQKALPGCMSHPSLLCVPDPTPTGLAQALFCTTWACFGQASASLSTYEPPHPKEGTHWTPAAPVYFTESRQSQTHCTVVPKGSLRHHPLSYPDCPSCPTVAPPEPQRLQEADVHVTGLQSCHRFYDLESITKEMLCASFFQGQKGFCKVSLLWPVLLSLIHQGAWSTGPF